MDKRTKAYKESIKEVEVSHNEHIRKQKESIKEVEVSHNIGGRVESLLEATGIAKVVKFLSGYDCGCDERKKKLNAMFTYKVNCLNEEEFTYLDEFFKGNPSSVQPSQYREVTKIASRVLNKRIEPSMGCGGCVRDVVKQMKQIYETYEA